MARRRLSEDEGERSAPGADPEVVVPHDPVNEQVALAAALVDAGARAKLVKLVPTADYFLVEQHALAWTAVLECERRKLEPDLATLQRVAGPSLDVAYLAGLAELQPDAPGDANLQFAADALQWDRARARAVQGPISSLLQAVKDPTSAPERVIALARSVGGAFDNAHRSSHLRDPVQFVREHVAEMRRRLDGQAVYPYGVPGLDTYEEGAKDRDGNDVGGQPRMLPGAAPKMVTVVTGISGGGKSTLADGHFALGLARQRRKVLIGMWEMQGMTLELLTALSLEWSRTDLIKGNFGHQELVEFEERAHALSQWVRFMDNPFGRHRGEKPSNERNLDVIQQHVEDSGCEVFIADLWERCLVRRNPEDVDLALFRQQSMAQETNTHHILLAQQRLKDIEQRADPRPTREGIKGTSAWIDIGDTIVGVHCPGIFKNIANDTLEAFIFKQRFGEWPIAVALDWNPEFGSLGAGRSIPYERVGEAGGDVDRGLGMVKPKRGKRRGG